MSVGMADGAPFQKAILCAGDMMLHGAQELLEPTFLYEVTVLLLRTQHLGLLPLHTRFPQQK